MKKSKKKTTKNASFSTKTFNDVTVEMGSGGDTHQFKEKKHQPLTTQQGCPISDDQNTLKVGQDGPTLVEDFVFREKLFHFDHERIPERVVHARGFGVHGYFENYESLTDITMAEPFQKKKTKTPAFVRFSTVAGSKGSVDLARDVRGFAVKLYTKAGNWDIVGNNIPVFFIQDAIKFPDLIHAAKEAPDRAFPQAQTAHDNFWDFISLSPESMHMIMWIMSDRAIPRSFRFMEGFGVHTFRMVNHEGKSSFVKFHWKPKYGVQSVTWDEAVQINGADPDYHRRDLWHAIQNGDFPEWELGLQIFDEKFANDFPFDVLDATKLIPEEEVPVRIVGRLVLNQCVDNFFAETEQVAFCTQNIIPGIDFTADPLLQGRNFSYLDTQLKRLGSPNFTHLPINAPKCPFANFQQDGHMAFHNVKGRANYSPNSWDKAPREDVEQGFRSYPQFEEGEKLRVRPEKFADHYSQARQFYLSQHKIEQQHMINALVFELSKVEETRIRLRMVSHLLNIDKDFATAVAAGLGIETLPEPAEAAKPTRKNLATSPKLSILNHYPEQFAGRKVGIILGEGVDDQLYSQLTRAIKKAKADYTIIAQKVGGVRLKSGKSVAANEQIEGAPSALFDAVAILLTSDDQCLLNHPKLYAFIGDAYRHQKFIAYSEAVSDLVDNIHPKMTLDDGMIKMHNKESIHLFLKQCHQIRFWERNV